MELFLLSNLYSKFLILNVLLLNSFAVFIPTPNQKIHLAHFDASRVNKEIKSLKVAAVLKEPFMYRDDSDQLYKGIEFELLKIIAAKENLELSINIVGDSKQIDEQTLK